MEKIHVKGKYCAGPNCDCRGKLKNGAPSPGELRAALLHDIQGDALQAGRIEKALKRGLK